MKKNYEKPEMEYVSFQFVDSIMGDTTGGLIGGEDDAVSIPDGEDVFG